MNQRRAFHQIPKTWTQTRSHLPQPSFFCSLTHSDSSNKLSGDVRRIYNHILRDQYRPTDTLLQPNREYSIFPAFFPIGVKSHKQTADFHQVPVTTGRVWRHRLTVMEGGGTANKLTLYFIGLTSRQTQCQSPLSV